MKSLIAFPIAFSFLLASCTIPDLVEPVYVDSLIIHPHSEWEYKLVTPESNWKLDYGTWNKGTAPFGNIKLPNYYFNWNTLLPPSTATFYLRNKVNLKDYNLNEVMYHIGVDNGYELWVNGKLVSKKTEDGKAIKWEYEDKIPASFLKQGDNFISFIIINDTKYEGWTSFDMQLTGKAR